MPTGFLQLEPPPADEKQYPGWLRNFWVRFTTTQQGKLNCVTSVTLAAGATTTNLTDQRISEDSDLILTPTTANAAAATTNVYVSAKSKGVATFTHANAATTNRTYDVSIIG